MNPSVRLRRCKNCGHYIKTNKEMGSLVNPNKVWHWIDGWGSKQCPHCNCDKPELRNRK